MKEKADYAECTAMAFKKYKFDFLLVIQDDVVAKENALSNIIQVTSAWSHIYTHILFCLICQSLDLKLKALLFE